jgi:glutamine amidotransferase
MNVTVIDYKIANIYNITKALEALGANVSVTQDAHNVAQAEKLVLPGVGAYEAGVEGLKRYRLIAPIRELARKKVPILGICLGAQLLMREGHEFGTFEGLGLISGTVELFPNTLKNVKVPHIGWDAIEEKEGGWNDTILASVPLGAQMYFNHSYYLKPESNEQVLASTTYGGFTYAAVIRNGTVYGCQFHPEKSANHGLMILKNFLSL